MNVDFANHFYTCPLWLKQNKYTLYGDLPHTGVEGLAKRKWEKQEPAENPQKTLGIYI